MCKFNSTDGDSSLIKGIYWTTTGKKVPSITKKTEKKEVGVSEVGVSLGKSASL